jgi:hypothetical protein
VHDHIHTVDCGVDTGAGEEISSAPIRPGIIRAFAPTQRQDLMPGRESSRHYSLAERARRPGDKELARHSQTVA